MDPTFVPANLNDLLTPPVQVVPPAAQDLAQRRREAAKLHQVYTRTLNRYEGDEAKTDATNRDYFCGRQWRAPTLNTPAPTEGTYKALQNEIFPAIDSLMSTLISELPQVTLSDRRAMGATMNPQADLDLEGRALAQLYNWFAEADGLDETLDDAMLNAMVFDKGATVLTTWDTATSTVNWESLPPDKVFFDPVATRHRRISWAFRLSEVHWDDFCERVCSGEYTLDAVPAGQEATIAMLRTHMGPEEAPVRPMDRSNEDPGISEGRRMVPEYVALVEWYDCRKGICHHLHRETGTLLASYTTPIRNPFRRLVPVKVPSGSGGAGVSMVTLLEPQQRVINDMVAGRREFVFRMMPRLLVPRDMFANDEAREKFQKSKAWEPVYVEPPAPGEHLQSRIAQTPQPSLGFDFNAHLGQSVDSLRHTAGAASFLRGESENIRTAAEADMVHAAVNGRITKMNARITKFIGELFEDARAYTRWAVLNPEHSKVNLEELASITQVDIPMDQFVAMLSRDTRVFKVEAYNPLMRDARSRLSALEVLLPTVLASPHLMAALNVYELARELTELVGLRRSIMQTEEAFQAATAPQGAPGGMPGGVPSAMPGDPAGMPSEEGALPEEGVPPGAEGGGDPRAMILQKLQQALAGAGAGG